MDVLKGFVTIPKATSEPHLTQTSEPAPKEPKIPAKRGRKPRKPMTFTVTRGDFVVKMD